MTRLSLLTIALVVPNLLVANRGLAHDIIDEARGLYQEAELDAALDALARAEDAGVTRTELLDLLDLRLILNISLGRTDEAATDLRMLAQIDPDHELPPEVPPSEQEAFVAIVEAGSATLTIDLAMESQPGAAVFRAYMRGDPDELVRKVRIRARTASGLWAEDNDELVLPLTSSLDVYYYAEALGPGGAVLASSGSEDEPLVERYAPGGGAEEEPSDGISSGAIIGIGVGVAVAVAVAVLLAILLRDDGGPDTFQPGAPSIEF